MSKFTVIKNEFKKGYALLLCLTLILTLFGFYKLNSDRIKSQEIVVEEMLHAFIITMADGISVGYFQWDEMYEAFQLEDQFFIDAYFNEVAIAFPIVSSVEIINQPSKTISKYDIRTNGESSFIEFKIYNSEMNLSIEDRIVRVNINPQKIFEQSFHQTQYEYEIFYETHGNVQGIKVVSKEMPLKIFHLFSAIGVSLLSVLSIHTFKRLSVSAHYEIEGLANIVMLLSQKDEYTASHSEDVAKYAVIIAEKLGLGKKERRVLNKAGYLHDLGKIGISESIMNKRGKLTKEEYEEIKKHSTIGYEIVSQFPNLKDVAIIVKYHHELLDGSGYPDGLVGDEIPLVAQVLAVADVFSALTTDRPYREGFTYWKAFEIMADMPLNQQMVTLLKEYYTVD